MTSIKLISIFVFLLLALKMHGQGDDKSKPALITFTAGWSWADLVQDDVSTDNRNGIFVGIRKDVKIVPMLFIDTGLLYVQEGGTIKIEDVPGIGDVSTEVKLDYLNLPVGLKFKIASFYAIAGFSGNFKISDNLDDGYYGDNESDIKTFDLTSSLGLGFKFLMISADFRWNTSLGDIVDNNPGSDLANSYFMFGLGFSIHKNK